MRKPTTNQPGGKHVMSQVTTVLYFIAVLFVGVAAVTPWPSEAASPSKADKAALKRAIVAC